MLFKNRRKNVLFVPNAITTNKGRLELYEARQHGKNVKVLEIKITDVISTLWSVNFARASIVALQMCTYFSLE